MDKCIFCYEFENGKCREGVIPTDCNNCHVDYKKVQKRYPLMLEGFPETKEDWVRCWSFSFKDTPKTLYRFLYLWKPEEMDFSDMYKCVLALIDLNGVGIVELELYKYEVSAYLYVHPSELKPRPHYAIEISCGVPGTENEEFIEGSKAKEEFEMLGTLLEMTHAVYPGNNFEV